MTRCAPLIRNPIPISAGGLQPFYLMLPTHSAIKAFLLDKSHNSSVTQGRLVLIVLCTLPGLAGSCAWIDGTVRSRPMVWMMPAAPRMKLWSRAGLTHPQKRFPRRRPAASQGLCSTSA